MKTEYKIEDWEALHEQFFSTARQVEDVRLRGRFFSYFIKAFQIGYDLGGDAGIKIREDFHHKSLLVNEPDPDIDHSRLKLVFLEGHELIKWERVDPLLPSTLDELMDFINKAGSAKYMEGDTERVCADLKNWRNKNA